MYTRKAISCQFNTMSRGKQQCMTEVMIEKNLVELMAIDLFNTTYIYLLIMVWPITNNTNKHALIFRFLIGLYASYVTK